MKRNLAIASALVAGLCIVPRAEAFCGFYVAGGDQQMFNDATQVVLMRSGTRTVLAMQNNYKGPPDAFAMVIPVPTVLHEGDVKTLTKDVFEHVEKMGAPRLVEYWEQDPCGREVYFDGVPAPMAVARSMADPKAGADKDYGVKIEAQFTVGEYNVVILSAKDSTGLEKWLLAEKYKIPNGAEPLLRPYVEGGMKFFVAKVDPAKVKFVDGRAALSPLRFHYDSEDFSLPIRLGLANSSGTQDLIVNILAPSQRYDVANYKNVTIPTNIDVNVQMKDRFAAFYTALFDRTIEKNPGAVITEYAWQATTCDPCPGPALDPSEFQTLGADVLAGTHDKPGPYYNADFVLTRLHARYGKTVTDDLRFKQAPAIVGGREFVVANGKLEEGSQPSSVNNFQGRYAIRHAWTGAVACQDPKRGRWGGPPPDVQQQPGYIATGVMPATGLAFAPRGQVDLPQAVQQDVPEIGLKRAAAAVVASPGVTSANPPATTPTTPPAEKKKKSGCGCGTGGIDPGAALALLGVAGLLRRRRRGAA